MPRLLVARVLMAAIMLLVCSASPAHTAPGKLVGRPVPAPDPGVTVDGDLLSVDVRDAPLGGVLRTIADQTSVPIVVRGVEDKRVTESFAGVPLDEAIQRLALGCNLVLVYGPPGGETGRGRLVEARIYQTSTPAVTIIAQQPQPRPAAEVSIGAPGPPPPGALAQLAEKLLGDADPLVRREAAVALGNFRGPEVVEALTSALEDHDPSVRIKAVLSLGGMQDQGLAGIITQVLVQDPDADVRRTAILALYPLRTEDVYRGLQAAATQDPDASVRYGAAGALDRWEQGKASN